MSDASFLFLAMASVAPDKAVAAAPTVVAIGSAETFLPATEARRPFHRRDPSPANEQADTRHPLAGLAGDWFGLKRQLADKGVTVFGRYVSEAAWNATGGQQHEVEDAGEFDVGLGLDLRRIAGIVGSLQATVTYRRGHQLDQRARLGTLQEVQEIYGGGQTWRLTEFWYEISALRGAIDVKVGRTSPDQDFAAFSCSFQNLSFCGSQPGNLVGDYWYNWPISQWGGRARLNLGRAYLQLAVYEENPRNLERDFTLGRFHGATGALIPAEAGFVTGGATGGRIGSYKIGGWLSTADAPDLFLDHEHRPAILTGTRALERQSAYGFWINVQQQLTGRSDQGKSTSGLSVFFNLTEADRRTSWLNSQLALGLFEKGLLPWFTEDVLGVGVARTHVNRRVAQAEMLAGAPPQKAEYEAELYYGFHPRPWLELRPNLQWVHHPGGYRGKPGVGVVGLKTALTL